MEFTKVFEETSAGDIAVHTPKLGLSGKGKKCKCCGEILAEKLSVCQSASDALMRLQDSTHSTRLIDAIDEVLDIMDTDC